VQELGDAADRHSPSELLEDYPLKAHETLQDRTDRVVLALLQIAERNPDDHVWIVDREGKVRVQQLADATNERDKKRLEAAFAECTVLLPPRVGGLSNGLLSGSETSVEGERYDVADQWLDENGEQRRGRTFEDVPRGMRIVRVIDLTDVPEAESDDAGKPRLWTWFVEPKSADDDGSRSARAAELLVDHLGKARERASAIATKLVAADEAHAVTKATEWHDLGKDRRVWQRSIGNLKAEVLAKSGPGMKPREITKYRHEFGSLIDVVNEPEFQTLGPVARDLVLHTIASHHGRARPHFPFEEAFDPERPTSKAVEVGHEVPRRFARLQARYGRWGLAYLESLVRAADALASQDIASRDEAEEAAE
jgi:CRISPR-associated endonuclease/helicase Cas3